MDKTYAEMEGEPPFDWNKFLDNAISNNLRGEDTIATDLSNSWVTCACGNQCSIIPRHSHDEMIDGRCVAGGEPVDLELSRLGLDFNEYIDQGEWRLAKSTLIKIEERAKILIKQERSKLQGAAS